MIKIEINTGNAAFDGNERGELSRILRRIADDIENGKEDFVILDINGNKVGTARHDL